MPDDGWVTGGAGLAGGKTASAEARIVERLRARDVQAFESLYRTYHSRLSRFVGNVTRRPQLVEEVVNDTMMVVWNRIGTFNGTSKLSTWIFAIAYRQALSALRRWDEPVDDKTGDRMDPAANPEEALGESDRHQTLMSALNALSPAHRSVVELTYFHDMGYREIAEVLDCPVDTVKTRMFHARRHLKRVLPGEFADWQ